METYPDSLQQVLFGGMGGHVAVALTLADALPETTHRLLFYGTDLPAKETIAQCEKRGFEWSAVQKKPGLDFEALTRLYDILLKWGGDLTIMHSLTALLAGLLWESGNRKLLVVDHTSASAKSDTEWAASLLASYSSELAFLTLEGSEALKAKFPMITKPHHIIPNGVNSDYFRPAPNKRSRKFRVTMLARFCPERDFIGLVDAFKRFSEHVPDSELVLAGGGETWNDVNAHVRASGLEDKVKLPGVLDEIEVLELLQSTDVYVQWSLADSMSTSVMQAMACGTPVIATRISGMDGLVSHGETGLLLPRDSFQLSENLLMLAQNADLRKEMGTLSRDVAVAKFSNHSMARAYLNALEWKK